MFDPISLGITAVGMATSLFGASKAKKAQKQAMWAQQRITNLQNASSATQTNASMQISGITQQQEQLRLQQLRLEATKARRDVVRQAQLARATAVSRAANQGALNSTALAGVIGNIRGQQAEQSGRILTDIGAAETNFALNKDILTVQNETAVKIGDYNKRIAKEGGVVAQANADADFGKSLFNIGTNLMGNATQTSSTLKSLFPSLGSV